MAQVSVGKLLPNLKVTLGNDPPEIAASEDKGCESSEDLSKSSLSSSNVEIVRSWMESLQNPKIYKNKSGGFTTGLDLISEENSELLGKRAERFGLEESSLAPNIRSLYESMGLSGDSKNSGTLTKWAKGKSMRLDALHMRGVNDLSTNEIFHYFRDYGPASVEWINDFSCNVVWLDEVSCARALLGVSKELTQQETNDSKESPECNEEQKATAEEQSKNEGEEEKEVPMEVVEAGEPPIPIPPGHWRLGTPHPKAKSILLRFATKDDKKLPGAEKRSEYYKKYGNPNYGGLVGLISGSRKRKMQAASNRRAVDEGSTVRSITLPLPDTDVPAPKVSQPKPPRMRMYADDEEIKKKKLSVSRPFRSSGKVTSVHSRLGNKYTKNDLCRLGTHQRDDPEDDDDDSTQRRRWSVSEDRRTSERRSPYGGQLDLRAKLRDIRSERAPRYRSPLCVNSDE